jgi:hypothetical protein
VRTLTCVCATSWESLCDLMVLSASERDLTSPSCTPETSFLTRISTSLRLGQS